MGQTRVLWGASIIAVVLCVALLKARDLAAARVHNWPVTTTEIPNFGVAMYADDVPNGSSAEGHLTQAEPFILCRELRKHPSSKYRQFSLHWNSIAAEGEVLSVETSYDRSKKILSLTSGGVPGGTHCLCYTNVNDNKLFHLVDAAGTFGKADFADLEPVVIRMGISQTGLDASCS